MSTIIYTCKIHNYEKNHKYKRNKIDKYVFYIYYIYNLL